MSQVQTNSQGIVIKPYSVKPRAPREVFTPLGSKYMIRAKLSYDKDGNKIAEPGEKIDLDAYIQSSKQSTDIALIVERAKNGDLSVLNVDPNPFFGDATILPKNPNDYVALQGTLDKAKADFEKLPDDIKLLFENDSTKFFNAILSNKANEILAKYEADKQAAAGQPAQALEGGNE